MSRGPTLKDVAKVAGVHPGTVSKALNPLARKEVSPKTVEVVLLAAQQLGYRPDPIARSLRTQRSNVVGIIIPDLTNPVFPPAIRGIEDALREHGYTCLLGSTDNDPGREREIFEAMQGRRVDGFIIGTAMRAHPLLVQAHNDAVALVQLNRVTDGCDLPAVLVDDAGGVQAAVRHCIELGHTRLAHLAGPSTMSTAEVRRNAFVAACERHNDVITERVVVECTNYSIEAGEAGARQLLDQAPAVGAILGGNDLIALGACRVLAEQDRQVPHDVSVIGFNDMPFLDMFEPPLTSVHVPQYELGAESARLLLERLSGGEPISKRVLLPSRLVVRGSTAPAST